MSSPRLMSFINSIPVLIDSNLSNHFSSSRLHGIRKKGRIKDAINVRQISNLYFFIREFSFVEATNGRMEHVAKYKWRRGYGNIGINGMFFIVGEKPYSMKRERM